jgi:rubrerythrin
MDEFQGFEQFLAAVDRDGAIAETTAGLRSSRKQLLAAGFVGAAAAALGSAGGASAALSNSDVSILNYALVLEYLQASFYTEAELGGALHGATRKAANVIGAVERAHVTAFRKLLGRAAVKRPLFDFQGVTEKQLAFLKTAVAFEDLAVAAYKGQAPLITSRAVLAAAVGIHSVEARHAAWMRELFGITPAVHAFDQAASRTKISRVVASTGFIAARPVTQRKHAPEFTG